MCSLAAVVATLSVLAPAPALAADAGQAKLGNDGRLRVSLAGDNFCSISPAVANTEWQFAGNKPQSYRQEGLTRKFTLTLGKDPVAGEAVATQKGDSVAIVWTYTGDKADLKVNALAVSADFEAQDVIGGTWTADDKTGQFPADFGEAQLFTGRVLDVTVAKGDKRLTIRFARAHACPDPGQPAVDAELRLRIGRQGDQARGRPAVCAADDHRDGRCLTTRS